MQEKRIVFVKRPTEFPDQDPWHQIEFKQLAEGDVFKIFDGVEISTQIGDCWLAEGFVYETGSTHGINCSPCDQNGVKHVPSDSESRDNS